MKAILSRRRAALDLLAWCAAGGALLPRLAVTQPSAKVDVKDPAAIALHYVENAANVDATKDANFIKDSNCGNCLQLQGHAGSDYRPCTLFDGKLVSVIGWCSGWTAEM